jgi:hypothetical protein
MSSPLYAEGRGGYSLPNASGSGYGNTGHITPSYNFETLTSYYQLKPPIGSALAFAAPTGSDIQLLNMNRTRNPRIPNYPFGYDTLVGRNGSFPYGWSPVNAPGNAPSDANYFSLNNAYASR